MPKLGQRLPYRVSYAWANGVTGSTARHSLDEAELLADRIEASARARDLPVTITIRYVAKPGGAGTVIATIPVTLED